MDTHVFLIIDKEYLESNTLLGKHCLFKRIRLSLCDLIPKLLNKFTIETICQYCKRYCIAIEVLLLYSCRI